jgi:hypothetical protein
VAARAAPLARASVYLDTERSSGTAALRPLRPCGSFAAGPSVSRPVGVAARNFGRKNRASKFRKFHHIAVVTFYQFRRRFRLSISFCHFRG